ncbi:MAG: DUF4188 domain-containing protein [Alphaproteobacteria bacterium]|nr:DUF4188 domain-containing protein [Alphaproteobacteria bacterium]
MAGIVAERMAAEIDGDFVVFVIGMRVNRWWKPAKWLPVALAMPRMLKELRARPESGFLGAVQAGFVTVQYWRSFEQLEAYARDREGAHWPAWTAFNRRMKHSRGDVGIWHETYLVPAGAYEAIYIGMPCQGLGAAGRLVPATGKRETARGRAGGRELVETEGRSG